MEDNINRLKGMSNAAVVGATTKGPKLSADDAVWEAAHILDAVVNELIDVTAKLVGPFPVPHKASDELEGPPSKQARIEYGVGLIENRTAHIREVIEQIRNF